MLIVPENVKDYFAEVREWAYENNLRDAFDKAMLRCHLYGCTWEKPEECRVVIYASDFAPKSFLYRIEKKTLNGEFSAFLHGGLIFHGELHNDRLVKRDEHTGWGMHS